MSVAVERQTTHNPQPQTPEAPPSPEPPMIPADFQMYEEWENLTHKGEIFTVAYRQQIYEIRSENNHHFDRLFQQTQQTCKGVSRNRVGMSSRENTSLLVLFLASPTY